VFFGRFPGSNPPRLVLPVSFLFFAGRKDGGCWSVLGPLE
jgi:hypothetical protein